jgi:hypothetical protein
MKRSHTFALTSKRKEKEKWYVEYHSQVESQSLHWRTTNTPVSSMEFFAKRGSQAGIELGHHSGI